MNHTVRIAPESVDEQFSQNLGALIRWLADERPAKRVPSPQECLFCDISAADRPLRMDGDHEPTQRTTADLMIAEYASSLVRGARGTNPEAQRAQLTISSHGSHS